MMHRNKDGVWTFDEFHRKYIKLNQWELESSQAQSVKQEIYESWTIFIFLVKKRQLTSYSNFGSIPTTVEKARDYKHFFSSKFPKLAISHRWRFNVRDKMTLAFVGLPRPKAWTIRKAMLCVGLHRRECISGIDHLKPAWSQNIEIPSL